MVTGDTILLRTANGEISIFYTDTHLILGSAPKNNQVLVMTEGTYCQETAEGVQLQDTQDGDITGLLQEGDRFAFGYGHSREEVIGLLKEGIRRPLEPLKTNRLQLYKAFSLDNAYGPLYAKCLSVMKTQLYSPEGQFKHIWSTPDRLPHKRLWLWDSVFHAIGHRHLDTTRAEGLILSVCDTQGEDGFIPHMASPDTRSSITQPPVLALGAWLVYEISKNKAFLQRIFDCNKKFLLWCQEDGFYYDYDIVNNCFHKVQTVASFLPLFAGICDEQQAQCLVAYLQDPKHFCTPFPIPSVSRQHPTYGTDMWRGAVWVNYNHMIIGGLEAYGYRALADEIRDKTLHCLNQWYLRKGTLFEFYDSENDVAPNEMNRKGSAFEPYDFNVRMQSIRDYGWSCTLCFDLLHRKYAPTANR